MKQDYQAITREMIIENVKAYIKNSSNNTAQEYLSKKMKPSSMNVGVEEQ